MAIRSNKNVKISVLVADAAGKGVQAALVIHAVQALWADALSAPHFDPNSWLCKVNNTLYRMGHGQSHSATIGVLTLDEKEIEYWSAGHMPALVVDQSQTDEIHPLPARGPMLGLQEINEFISFKRDIGKWSFHILLASDGVFAKGATESPRAVRHLLNAPKNDPNFLTNLSFQHDDDRTLILIHVDPSKIKPKTS